MYPKSTSSATSSSHPDIDFTQPKKPQSVTFVPEPLLDSEEAAAIMKIHPKTLQKLARKGLIRGAHVGKLWRFRASEIESWIQRQIAG